MSYHSQTTARSIKLPSRGAPVPVRKAPATSLPSQIAAEAAKNPGGLIRRLRRMKRKLFLSHVDENHQLRLMRTFSGSSESGQFGTSQASLQNQTRCLQLRDAFEAKEISDAE